MRTKIQDGAQNPIPEARYGYYRRCQRFRRNGHSAKPRRCKARTDATSIREQADIERRRRKQFTLPPLVDLNTVQRTIGELVQALLEDRIDEDYAGELLQKLESASIRLRPAVGVGNLSPDYHSPDDRSAVTFPVNDLALL